MRRGQRLQVPFETAVKAENGGFLKPSIDKLKEYITNKEQEAGSLFGKVAEFDFGEDRKPSDKKFSVDDLITGIQKAARGK